VNLPGVLVARQRRRLLARLVLNGTAQAAVAIVAALLARKVPLAASGSADATIVEIGFTLCVAAASLFTLRVTERADAERLGQHYVTRVRMLVFDHVIAGALHGHGHQRYGLTMTGLVSDLSGLRDWVSSGLARLLVAGLSLVGVFVALTLVSPVASTAAGITVTVFACGVVLAVRSQKDHVREMRRRRGHLAANLGEKVLAAGAIQQFGQTSRERRQVRHQGRRLARAAVERATGTAMLRSLSDMALPLTAAIMLIMSNIPSVLASSQSGLRTAAPDLGVGDWTATIFLFGMLQGALRDLARACIHRLAYEQGRARIEEVIETPIPKDSFVARDLPGDGPLEVDFEDVHVGTTLSGFAGHVRPGESVAVQGPSGSGKSTVLALTARLRDAEVGLVYLGGQPVSHWTITSIRRAVMLVSPDVPLLAGTIIQNIEYGSGPLTARRRAELLRLTGVGAALATLPDRLDTRITEGGRNLPEGICARVRLARALACAPRALLIDDPVFWSDGDARAALTRVIATRRSTILIAAPGRAFGIKTDRVWRIDGGRLAEVAPGAKVIPLAQAH